MCKTGNPTKLKWYCESWDLVYSVQTNENWKLPQFSPLPALFCSSGLLLDL